VTSSSVFSYEHVLLSLHLDGETGEVYHVGVSAPGELTALNGNGNKKTKEKERVSVKLVKASQGPQPKLNRPVILDAEGKVPEKEPEKSFFQK
jgi:hypothetical protein